MLASMHPLGERARSNRWSVTATAYTVASAIGGVAVGALAGTAGWAVSSVLHPSGTGRAVAAAIAVVVAVPFELGWVRLPTVLRQVRKEWMEELRGWVYGAGFGFQLGLGVVTIVTTSLIYLFLVLAAVTASPVAGAVIGATFGLARALPILAVRRVHDGDQLRLVHRRFQALAALGRRASVTTLLIVGAATIGMAGRA
jgi:cytochrome c biogenesis protein CcdA